MSNWIRLIPKNTDKQFRQAIHYMELIVCRPIYGDERDEAIQECWLRWLGTDDPEEQANPFLCGRRAVALYWRREAKASHWLHLDELIAYFAEDAQPRELDAEIAETLLVEFYGQRKKKGSRGLNAAAKDVAIISLLCQGYNDHAVAIELGMTYMSVRGTRREIKKRLRRMLEAHTEVAYHQTAKAA